jgi:hypothetical protein
MTKNETGWDAGRRPKFSRRKFAAYLGAATLCFLVSVGEFKATIHSHKLNTPTEIWFGSVAIGMGAAGLAYREMLKDQPPPPPDTEPNIARHSSLPSEPENVPEYN